MTDSARTHAGTQSRVRRLILGYGSTLLAAVLVFLAIRQHGETLPRPTTPAVEATGEAAAPRLDSLLRLLGALAAVIVVGQALARVFVYFHQPPVIGEVLAGILLGPSLLGPEVSAFVLPPSQAQSLWVVAQVGVILYMFLVGLELNGGLLRRSARIVAALSVGSILAPFLCGAALAVVLYSRLGTSVGSFTHFALFLGVALSITAFPVLARILSDLRMSRTELGSLGLSCAAVNDVAAWCLLAAVIGIVNAEVGQGLWVAAGAAIYSAVMFLFVRPVVARVARSWESENLTRGHAAAVFVGLLVSALVTEAIGIHAIFGAFLFGAIIPHDSEVARGMTRQLEHVATVLFLPAFFAFTGMRTQIHLVTSGEQWLICGLIIVVATVGKFGGTIAAARFTGLSWRDSAILGTLMNTRGLMELIVLNIGLDLRVISPTLFAMMVIMALVTTLATSPVLKLLTPRAIHNT